MDFLKNSKRGLSFTVKKSELLAVVLLLFGLHLPVANLHGATITAASAAFNHVKAAVDAAGSGDVVVIPSGSASWSSTLSISKPITLQGAGIDATTIVNAQNDVNAPIINLGAQSSGLARITGMTLNGNGSGRGITVGGSPGEYFRIDHVKFVRCDSRAVYSGGDHSGLIDNCVFVNCIKTADVYGSSTGTDSWNRLLTLGDTNCVVIEDCYFHYDSGYPEAVGATTSSGLGGRRVWRYNTWSNFNANLNFYPIIDAHGNQAPVSGQNANNEPPGGTGTHRGTRQFEMYKNTLWAASGSNCRLTDLRGGTCLIFSNTFVGPGMQNSFRIREEDGPGKNNFRSTYPGYDPHRLWFWQNHANGALINSPNFEYAEDPRFIVAGVNLFWTAPLTYTPLQYPHPLRGQPAPPNPGAFRLGASSYSIAENSGNVTIAVQRSGGSLGAVSIAYGTTNGSALAGNDFTATTGVLTWANGEAGIKTFTVGISNDTLTNGSRSFVVGLANPTGGATLGSPSSAAVTIVDDDQGVASDVPLMPGLVFDADDGLVDPPYIASDGLVWQTVETTNPTLGGRARWRVTIPETGAYVVRMIIEANSAGSDSLFINFDTEPTNDNVWNVSPLTSGLEDRTVGWPTENPKLFQLSAGSHTLIVRGREANCRIQKIAIVKDGDSSPPAPPTGLRLIVPQ